MSPKSSYNIFIFSKNHLSKTAIQNLVSNILVTHVFISILNLLTYNFFFTVTNQLKKSCPNNSSFASVTGNASSRDNYSGSKCKDEYINDNCKTG